MRKLTIMAALALSTMLLPFSEAPASAAQDLPPGCTKDRGKITCTETVGNAPTTSNAQTTTTTSRGNLTNKKKCEGPRGQCR